MAKRIDPKVEVIWLPKRTLPKKLNLQCIRCDKPLECDLHSQNAEDIPNVYGGVVFRSSGQYGSTVLDCGAGIPHGYGNEVQIILCDECVKANGDRINTMKNKRPVIVAYTDKLNLGRTRLDEWSDYSTFNEMNGKKD